MPVYLLTEAIQFPPPHLAREDGLLALGGDLSTSRLRLAYRMGIFPWYSQGEPLLWWSPDPRLVLYPDELHVPRSLRKVVRQARFAITLDTAFSQVIQACSRLRAKGRESTWILPEMIQAYINLHEAGIAHSAEAWFEGQLAGGLYGVSLGQTFFGESMFTYQSNASKTAFVALVAYLTHHGFDLIDCQITTDHLLRFGAREIRRERFLSQLAVSMQKPTLAGKWDIADMGEWTHGI